MTENFETDALQYLLGEMESSRRAQFEQQLARDPRARAALKACADSMARFACETAPAEPMGALEQQAALAAITEVTSASPKLIPFKRPQVTRWSRYIWPVAAALLLGLNLIHFKRPLSPIDPVERGAGARAEKQNGASGTSERNAVDRGTEAPSNPGQVARSASQQSETPPMALTTGERREFDLLRRENVELRRRVEALRAERDGLVSHLAERALQERRAGRLAAMELVDSGAYARGERRGLVEIARGVLSEPGVIVDRPETSPTPGPSPISPIDPATGSSVPPGTQSPSNLTANVATPYAWSVYDDVERQGNLNLYNLPAVEPNESLQLWVKPVGATDFQRIGEVPPEFYGRSGSVRYHLPDVTSAPGEILVTREPKNAAGGKPAGSVVLRGP